jgi:AmiR/NasT family two-component response regulator
MLDKHHRESTERDAISCATGILMERYGCDARSASDRLVEWSQDIHIDVVDVAVHLIADAGQAAVVRR